jgi:diguanylate cyclase (GGDEF)-like protein
LLSSTIGRLFARSPRGHRAANRISNLEALYAVTLRLSALTDSDDIILVSLQESASILGAKACELRLPPELGGLRCFQEGSGDLGRDFGAPGGREIQVAETRAPVVVHGARGGGAPGLISVPVNLGDLGTGVLTAFERGGDSGGFAGGDLRFLEALSAYLGAALTSSQRLDRLHLEVAAREHQALHDGLTGLANRVLFGRWVSEALVARGRADRVGVMLMDLDGFKDINDTLGHHTGDRILEVVAQRVTDGLGRGRLAARLGGDEFAIVLPGAASAEEIVEIGTAVHASVSRPVTVDGMELEIRASVGVAVAPEDGVDLSTLLRRADVAMYAAKRSRRGLVVYDRDFDGHAHRRLILTNALRQAMDDRQLEIWYQPMARPGTGEITGMEALLRWRHAEYGSIPPTEFIPVAERSGLIEPLTWWVLESALSELASWRREGFELTMAVNVSARSLTGSHVPERLRRLLEQAGIPAADLSLEITESLMMADPDGSQRVLEQLDQLGVRIAIDDFGTGWSSLSRLRRLPVHTVKIDRSFVMSMHRDEGDEAIVRTTIELARNMGHEVVAEGVERQDTWDRLVALGCDLVQGHLLAPAMPIDICRSWLKSRQSPRMAPVHEIRRAWGA